MIFSVHISILDKEVIKNLVAWVKKEAGVVEPRRWPPSLQLCVAALAHHKHIQFNLDYIRLQGHVDLGIVPTHHQASLVSSVRILRIENVSGCDLVTLLDSVQCEKLNIMSQSLGREETQALVRAMESRVEKVRLCDVELDMETLTKYSGQGRCRVLNYGTYEIATYIKYIEKLKTWAKEKTWIHKFHSYNHKNAPKNFHFAAAGQN